MVKLAKILAENMERLAAGLKMDQPALAKASGIAQPTISLYWNAQRDIKIESLIPIAKALRCEPWELLRPQPLNESHDKIQHKDGRDGQNDPVEKVGPWENTQTVNNDKKNSADVRTFTDQKSLHTIQSAIAAEVVTALKSELELFQKLANVPNRIINLLAEYKGSWNKIELHLTGVPKTSQPKNIKARS